MAYCQLLSHSFPREHENLAVLRTEFQTRYLFQYEAMFLDYPTAAVKIHYISKRALQWYSKYYRVAIVTETFTLGTQQHLEYRCKALFETPCITSGSLIGP
jgi:hypothetical protein